VYFASRYAAGLHKFAWNDEITLSAVAMLSQLKRFAYRDGAELRKITHLVEFPEFLDVSPYVRRSVCSEGSDTHDTPSSNTSSLYRLSSVIVHEGRTPHSGHYVCYVRRGGGMRGVNGPEGGWSECSGSGASVDGAVWYLANDELVRPAAVQEVRAQQAYILLYERLSRTDPSAAPSYSTGSTGLTPALRRSTLSGALQRSPSAPLSPFPVACSPVSPALCAEESSRFGANPLAADYLLQLRQVRADREQMRGAASEQSAAAAATDHQPGTASSRLKPRRRFLPGRMSFFNISASKRRQERGLQGLGQHLSAVPVRARQSGDSGGIEGAFFSQQQPSTPAGPFSEPDRSQEPLQPSEPGGGSGLKRRRLSDSWDDAVEEADGSEAVQSAEQPAPSSPQQRGAATAAADAVGVHASKPKKQRTERGAGSWLALVPRSIRSVFGLR
jgi:hypothetical protein